MGWDPGWKISGFNCENYLPFILNPLPSGFWPHCHLETALVKATRIHKLPDPMIHCHFSFYSTNQQCLTQLMVSSFLKYRLHFASRSSPLSLWIPFLPTYYSFSVSPAEFSSSSWRLNNDIPQDFSPQTFVFIYIHSLREVIWFHLLKYYLHSGESIFLTYGFNLPSVLCILGLLNILLQWWLIGISTLIYLKLNFAPPVVFHIPVTVTSILATLLTSKFWKASLTSFLFSHLLSNLTENSIWVYL